MTEKFLVELRCSKSSDGKYNATTYVNGKLLKEKGFSVNRGNEFSVVLIHQKIKKTYPDSELNVKGLDKHGMDMILRGSVSA